MLKTIQLGAVGALLDHIVRMRAVGELDDGGIGGLEIRGIEYLSLRDVMQVNSDALYSLQIFDEESHASVHSDKTKEGLSLFGILNNTRTTLGKALLREWLLRPSTSIPVINARHDAVACFIHPENVSTVTSMQAHLKGIKNVPKILAIMRTGKAQVADSHLPWVSKSHYREPGSPAYRAVNCQYSCWKQMTKTSRLSDLSLQIANALR